jgi:hypothetical protein
VALNQPHSGARIAGRMQLGIIVRYANYGTMTVKKAYIIATIVESAGLVKGLGRISSTARYRSIIVTSYQN